KFFRSQPAACRSLGADERVERVTATVGLLFTQRSSLRGSDVTRTDTVTLDVIFTIFRADVASQHLQATLGSGIGRHSLTTQFGHHRADIDNFTVALLHHGRQNSL